MGKPEIEWVNEFLKEIIGKIDVKSEGDPELRFALRRKIYKELTYAERSRPMNRVRLKRETRALQSDICPGCKEPLPDSYTVLDRFEAVKGYVASNVRVLCETCDRRIQRERRYTDKNSN